MFKSKDEVRRYVWKKLENICFSKPYGRIPNFRGARKACEKIRLLKTYKNSKLVFAAPDGVLLRLREIVLEDGKKLLAVLPKMKGFKLLTKKVKPTIKAISDYGVDVDLKSLEKVDIFAQGCVAVDLCGNRIGKGSGFGDKEYHMLKEMGLISDKTLYVVVAHDDQVFNDLSNLVEEHDVRADVILTPTRIIETRSYR